MKKASKIIWLIFSFLVIALGLTYFLYSGDLRENKIQMTEATASDNVYGWAWGTNFGWVSMNCVNDFDGDEKITLPGENHCSSECLGGSNDGGTCVDDGDCPGGGTCESREYGVNIASSGDFDDDSYSWSSNVGWFDYAPSSTVALDPFGVATDDCYLNTDGTVSGWSRSVANLWGNPNCHSWVRMRGDQMAEADFERQCAEYSDAGDSCLVNGDCLSNFCTLGVPKTCGGASDVGMACIHNSDCESNDCALSAPAFTWNAGTSTYQGTFPSCVSCDYYKKYCSGGENDGLACTDAGDCPDGSCNYSVVSSSMSGAEYRCGICYTETLVSGLGGGRLCVKTSNQNMCSGCTNNSDPTPDTCTDCPRCYEYGVAVDYKKNRLSGWAWGTLHKEVGTGNCGSNLGVGWLAFHATGTGVFAPWLESSYGGIYSSSGVGSAGTFRPPIGKYSATYAIHTGGTITNFYSASGSQWESQGYDVINFPDATKNYSSILGKIDFPGLQAGTYGNTESITSAADIDSVLGGKVYVHEGHLTISSPLTFSGGSAGTPNGSGTIIVRGNLYINDDIAYNMAAVAKLKYLPSVAFIVLGDVIVDSDVTSLVGAYVVLGDGTPATCPALSDASSGCGRFSSGTTGSGSTDDSLLVSGLVVAKQFKLERLFSSLDMGAERFVYDGRLLANTPPGLQDITQALPEWQEIAP